MGEGDGGRNLEEGRVGATEDVVPDLGMGLHDESLFTGEGAGLHEDRIGHADLADVVHDARHPYDLGLLFVGAGAERQQRAVAGHASDVSRGLVVLQLGRDR